MQADPVIRVIAKVLIPAMMLFALYVQFHGDYGPGGGFQAGVIFAAAFILNATVFGANRGRHVWPERLNLLAICHGKPTADFSIIKACLPAPGIVNLVP